MIIEKDKLIKKVSDNGYGLNRLCRICNKVINTGDIENKNFEYSKNQKTKVENFFHSDCVKKEKERMMKK